MSQESSDAIDIRPFDPTELPLQLTLTVAYQHDPEDGWWTSDILELNGCFSEGRSKEEARAMAFDAARLTLECRAEERRKWILQDPEARIDEEEVLHVGVIVPNADAEVKPLSATP